MDPLLDESADPNKSNVPASADSPMILRPELYDGLDDHLSRRDASVPETLLQLVARLTRYDTIDYTAMSDFFLTYRMFSSAQDVLTLLFSRLQWAAMQAQASSQPGKRGDERGHDVGVRTFVVIRYWLLNFFADDLLPSRQLRQHTAWAINTLYTLPCIAENPHFITIMHQIKRTWLSEVCTYWNLTTSAAAATNDLSLPVFSGGDYSATSGRELPPPPRLPALDASVAQEHRLTMLRFYDKPVAPISSPPISEDISDTTSEKSMRMGNLVRGGILIDGNVRVGAIKTSPQKIRPKKSILHMLSRRSTHQKEPLRTPPPEKITLDDKVDVLALRTVEELNALIKSRPAPEPTPSIASRHSDSLSDAEEFISSFDSSGTPTPRASARQGGLNDSDEDSDMEDFNNDFSDLDNEPRVERMASFTSTTPTVNASAKRKPQRDKTFDTLDINNANLGLANTSSDSEIESETDLHASITTGESPIRPWKAEEISMQNKIVNLRQSAHNWDMDLSQVVDAEVVSFRGSLSSLSTLSHPSLGPNEYDGVRSSITTVRDLDHRPALFEQFHDDYIGVNANTSTGSDNSNGGPINTTMGSNPGDTTENSANTSNGDTSNSAVDGDDTGDISLLSEISNSAMAPCRGFTPAVAAELSAIPDDSIPDNEDAVLVALQKLEGTYKRRRNALSMNSVTSSGTAGLYASAFRSQPDLSIQATRRSDRNSSKSALNSRASEVQYLAIPDIAGLEAAERAQAELDSNQVNLKTAPSTAGPNLISLVPPRPLSFSRHAPFILSASALDLCDQMTLIERDALEQIDWKELVECSWSREPFIAHSWLSVLAQRGQALRGVEIVTARFDLMVAWVKSEILLCESPMLRAATLSRYVHIASACVRAQNYATVVQIVVALTSAPISRLSSAWQLVHSEDRNTLEHLDKLISPQRNFSLLRDAHTNIDPTRGCIPFTGMYLNALGYNDQKASLTTDGRINFKKFQTAAALVRSLVQCVEWAKNCPARAKPSLLSRCLYLSTLPENEVSLAYE